DAANLMWRLAFAQNHFREALPDGTMVIEGSESQVFEGQCAQLFQRSGHSHFPASHTSEQALQPFPVHGLPFSGLATRSIRSLTAWRQDFPSNRTALTSRTIGISTPCRTAKPAAARLVRTPSATACIPPTMVSRLPP